MRILLYGNKIKRMNPKIGRREIIVQERDPPELLKTGFQGGSDFRFQILRDLSSTYVLRRPCSSSLYCGISGSSGWSDLVVNEEHKLSQFQN